MDCLFVTTTKYTLEEYKKYARAATKKERLIRALLLVVVWGFSVKDIKPFDIGIALMITFLFALIWLVVRILENARVEKVYFSNKVFQNAEMTYEFYDTYFVQKTENGINKTVYEKLNKIIATKTNIYLMIAKNQGHILVKENFPEGLEEFLRERKGKK